MAPKTLSNQRGQSLIESCLSALVLLFFLKLFCIALYSSYASLILNHHTHELAHCAGVYGTQQWKCRQQFKARLKQQLPWGKVGRIEVMAGHKSYVAKSEFHIINQWKLTSKNRATIEF